MHLLKQHSVFRKTGVGKLRPATTFCAARESLKKITTLSPLSVVVIYKKSHYIQSTSKIRDHFFREEKGYFGH